MKKNTVKATVNSKSTGKIGNSVDNTFTQLLQMFPDKLEFIFCFLDMFPLPVEVFSPDGTAIYLNQAYMKLHNATNPGFCVGKYNVLKDPVCNDQLGMRDGIQRAFSHGEPCVYYDVDAPIQDMLERGVFEQKPYEKSFADFHLYPIMNGRKISFVVFVWNVKKLYHGRPDLARAKAYMDTHWQSGYDKEKVAAAVNMSVAQLYRLFKEHTGMTPGDYHKRVKVERIKEKLLDNNLSIKEAFASCGGDSHSWLSTVFKQITGLSPTEFRKRQH